MVKGWHAAVHEWIVFADSNVALPCDYIQRLVATWTPGTGLVCSPPVGFQPDGFWAELECAFLNTFQARWQLSADSVGLGFAQGKSLLYRRSVLDDLGGIRALASEPAEDAATTKIMRAAGLRVRVVGAPFGQPLGRRSAREVWRGRCAGRGCGARRFPNSSCRKSLQADCGRSRLRALLRLRSIYLRSALAMPRSGTAPKHSSPIGPAGISRRAHP
jgi:hypothetical protein